MKTVVCSGLGCTGWGEAVAALLELNGDRPRVSDECVARMVSIGAGGRHAIQVAVVGSLGDRVQQCEQEAGCPLAFDGFMKWIRRLRVYHQRCQPPDAVEARKNIQSMLGKALRKQLDGATDRFTIQQIWAEAFSEKLPSEHAVSVEEEESTQLEVRSARLLTQTERDRLILHVPDDWVPAIERSVTSRQRGRIGAPIPEPWYKQTKWRLGITVGGFMAATILGGLYYIGIPTPAAPERLPEQFGELYRGLYDHPAETKHNYSLSASDLGRLRTTDLVCAHTFKAVTATPVTFDWIRPGVCDGYGGRIACSWSDDQRPAPFCYYFAGDTKFDYTAVGEAIHRYLLPAVCGIDCNSQIDHVRRVRQRTAIELVPSLMGMPVQQLSPQALESIGTIIFQRYLLQDDGCSLRCNGDECAPNHIAENTHACRCTFGAFRCSYEAKPGVTVTSDRLPPALQKR
ncbi:putative transmembrane protein [Gregarina niphandrodes]|uniref:Transmembrane protein n=1 Tax=Gregarina niphandrodes TaxID=110365 RepID=A0A023AZV6_GRENI|nr:putative transmembrane protein [Gregarina niphandrodes]EZG44425.1 putative transmembrane protein [Gregarina niphandrodes]|eukprot:XP_011134179.1 putative transmembrane protein [Gregarina niphandrodes]